MLDHRGWGAGCGGRGPSRHPQLKTKVQFLNSSILPSVTDTALIAQQQRQTDISPAVLGVTDCRKQCKVF